MSRVGKKIILVPENVFVEFEGIKKITIKGEKGKLTHKIHNDISVTLNDEKISCSVSKNTKNVIAQLGTTRSIINNLVLGVSKGFKRELRIIGVGYKVIIQPNNHLSINLGSSHSMEYAIPEGVFVSIKNNTEILLQSCNKELIGKVASEIRSYKKPDPYKGKGIRYKDEKVLTKSAKKK